VSGVGDVVGAGDGAGVGMNVEVSWSQVWLSIRSAPRDGCFYKGRIPGPGCKFSSAHDVWAVKSQNYVTGG